MRHIKPGKLIVGPVENIYFATGVDNSAGSVRYILFATEMITTCWKIFIYLQNIYINYHSRLRIITAPNILYTYNMNGVALHQMYSHPSNRLCYG